VSSYVFCFLEETERFTVIVQLVVFE